MLQLEIIEGYYQAPHLLDHSELLVSWFISLHRSDGRLIGYLLA